MSSGLKLAAGALLGAGLIEGFKNMYEAAAESAKVTARTNNVLQTTGGVAGISAKQVADLAAAISRKTGVDDEAIQSGENMLLTFTNVRNEVGKGNDIFDQATSVITDMSVALGQDSSSSAIQLGKALNDPIRGVTALQKVGVSFTQSQKDQIQTLVETGKTMDAQKIILAELSKEFGGAAEAASTPFGKLQVQLGNLAEDMGAYLIPVVDDLSKFLTDDLLPGAESVGKVVGGVLGPAFSGFGTTLKVVVEGFSALPGPLQTGVVALGAMAALKGPLGGVLDTLRGFGGGVGGTFKAFGEALGYAKANGDGLGTVLGSVGSAAGTAVKGGLGGMVGFFGGPWGLAITGATVGISLLVDWLGKSDKATETTQKATRDYADALREANGVINESVRQAAAKAAQDAGLLDMADSLGISLPTVTSAITSQGEALGSVRDRLKDYINQHTEVVVSGRAASTTLDDEGKAAKAALDSLNSLAGTNATTAESQQQLAAATSETGAAQGIAATFADQLKTGLQDTADAAGEARQMTDLFKGSLDALTGQTRDITEVEAQFWEAIDSAKTALDGATGSVLDGTGALDLHSEAGRKTRDQLVGLADDANSWISTMITQGATTADVTAKDQELRDNFYKTALQMTGNAGAAQALTDKYYGIPTSRNTTITADTGEAQRTIDSFVKGIQGQGLIGLIRTVGGKADGGLISGPGTGRSDTAGVFALSNGEFVVNAAATAQHRPFLEAINSGIRGMADGGYVNYPSSADFLAMVDMTADAKGKLKNAFSGLAGPGGAVQRWAGVVLQALGLLGQPGSLVGAVLQLIKHESGGNPNAINLTDSNARAGHPSQGLMQTIPGTFNAYAGQFRGLGITNPLANVFAGLNYGIHRYGSVMNIPGIKSLAAGGGYKPYDAGGLLMPGLTMAYNGTGRPETVRTAQQEAGLRGGVNVRVFIGDRELTDIVRVEAEGAVVDFATTTTNRGAYNGR